MGTRYYIISTLAILAITLTIGFITQKKSPSQLAITYLWITLVILIIAGLVYGISKVLTFLGIAESGFTL